MKFSDPAALKNSWLKRLGITRRQIALIFFLVLVFMIGMLISSWKQTEGLQSITDHDSQREYNKLKFAVAKIESVYAATEHSSESKVPSSIKTKININTASKDELVTLPGIGPVLAERILKYRKANKQFSASDELINVKGIGKVTMEKIKPFLEIK